MRLHRLVLPNVVGVAMVVTLVALVVVEAVAVAVVVTMQCSGGRGLFEDTVVV